MRSSTRDIAAAVLIAVGISAGAPMSFEQYARPGRLVDIGGRRINFRCVGSGRTTIVLESGLGFPSYSWRRVQPGLARLTRTCSYDRAGLGFSDPGPLPRTAGRMVDDLHAALASAGVKPPYLLVASSMGSQPARLFAFRFPREVAGLVLVDPYVEGQDPALERIRPSDTAERLRQERDDQACDADLAARRLTVAVAEQRGCIDAPLTELSPSARTFVQTQRLAPVMAAAVASERANYTTSSEAELIAATRPLASMPILVLTAGADFRGVTEAPALLNELRRLHRSLAELSTRGEERLVPGATHVIQASDPPAGIRAVSEVLNASR